MFYCTLLHVRGCISFYPHKTIQFRERHTVATIIKSDSTLDKEAFSKVVGILTDRLEKIIVPLGRAYLKFKFEEKPDFKEYSQAINEAEDDFFPSLYFPMVASYRLDYIPSLREEYYAAHRRSTSRPNQSLDDQISGGRFCALVSKEVENILRVEKYFKENKINVVATTDICFENEDSIFYDDPTDFLKVELIVAVSQ